MLIRKLLLPAVLALALPGAAIMAAPTTAHAAQTAHTAQIHHKAKRTPVSYRTHHATAHRTTHKNVHKVSHKTTHSRPVGKSAE